MCKGKRSTMIDRDLPISEERLKELREGLSGDAQMVLELVLSFVDSKADKEEAEFQEAFRRISELPEEDQEQIHHINEEMMKAYDRRIRESQAVVGVGNRAMADIMKAREF